jgi:exoribonuclease R
MLSLRAMKAIRDPQNLLSEGLAAIRAQFRVPESFPPEMLAAADKAATRVPAEHADWTDRPFVTLDPASSTDLDQAFTIERAGSDLLLHYAIADVAWFVGANEPGDDPLDTEAWKRGTTTYLPDGKANLYPPALSEKAASLLPGGPRPAVVLTSRIAPDGAVKLEGAVRALIQSRAKLAYETARDEDLPAGFAELAARIEAAEDRRGAARVNPPEQEVTRDAGGHFTLRFRPQLASEERNAAMSLASNLAVADALQAAHTGLFRVMAEPDAGAEARLRRTAVAFHLDWPADMPLSAFEKTLRATLAPEAAFMLAIRRAGRGASYVPFRAGATPWHSAMAATYAHCTAPLRRLADRYVLQAMLAVANGKPVPENVAATFERLPLAMARAEARDGQIDRAAIDLAEVALLANHEGSMFRAVVTDIGESGARIQLSDLPIVARVTAHGVIPGEAVRVRLVAADPVQRRLQFQRVS